MGTIDWDTYAINVGGSPAKDGYYEIQDLLLGKRLQFYSQNFQDAWENFSGDGVSSGIRDDFRDALAAGEFNELLLKINDLAKAGNPVVQGRTLDLESFEHSEFGFNDYDPESFVIRDGLQGMKDVALLHYARNLLIDDSIQFIDIVESNDFTKIVNYKNAFHQYGDENSENTKWMDRNGEFEYIIRETDTGFKVVTDPEVYGTYNFGNEKNGLSHITLDVDSWVIFGNLPEESFDWKQREKDWVLSFPKGAIPLTNDFTSDNLGEAWTYFSNTVDLSDQDDTYFIPSETTQFVFAGGGNDTIFSGSKADHIYGGSGDDTVSYIASEKAVAVNLGANAGVGYGKMGDASHDDIYEELIDVENVVGSHKSDIIIGNLADNKLYGANGDDLLKGAHGNDTLNGGSGYDTAIYDGKSSDYTVKQDTANLGTWIVTGIHGTDALVSIEAIQYADGTEELTEQNVEDSEFGQKLTTSNATAIINYMFAESSGMSISDINYTGSLDALRLLPNENTVPNSKGSNLTIGSGVFLTTGGMPGTKNTETGYSINLETDGDTDLDATAQLAFSNSGTTRDAAVIEFTFTLAENVEASTLSFEVMFGSEEYPEFVDSSYVDIAAVYVNGVNYALFNGHDDQPLSVVQKNIDAANLIDNTSGQYGIEYDGFSPVLKITAPIKAGENKVKIGIADTGDNILDSGLFIGNIQAGNSSGSGTFVPVLGTATDDNTVGDDSPEEFILGLGNDKVNPGGGFDVMSLGGGADTVEGTPDDLNGDIITDFTNEDKLVYTGVNFSKDQMTVTKGSAIIDVDLDGDGKSDTTTKLEGDFEFVEIAVENVDGNTVLTTSYIDQELFGTNGDDDLSGNVGDDLLVAGLGNNAMSGESGSDKIVSHSGLGDLSGGAGSDFIIGGFAVDKIDAGDGNDIVRGDASDFLGGSDELSGGGGDDILMGGRGADTFKFVTGDESDTIAAFDTGDVSFDEDTGYSVTTLKKDFNSGLDQIQLAGFSSVDASNVMSSVTDGSDGAVFSAEGTNITFYGVAAEELNADDFIFA